MQEYQDFVPKNSSEFGTYNVIIHEIFLNKFWLLCNFAGVSPLSRCCQLAWVCSATIQRFSKGFHSKGNRLELSIQDEPKSERHPSHTTSCLKVAFSLSQTEKDSSKQPSWRRRTSERFLRWLRMMAESRQAADSRKRVLTPGCFNLWWPRSIVKRQWSVTVSYFAAAFDIFKSICFTRRIFANILILISHSL